MCIFKGSFRPLSREWVLLGRAGCIEREIPEAEAQSWRIVGEGGREVDGFERRWTQQEEEI